MTFTDYPKAASENAKRALKFREETDNKNSCGTPVGWARANQLAKREAISLDTVKRMAKFKRHQQHKDIPYSEGCGGLMWDAWGGTEGIDWAIETVEQIEKEKKALYKYDILNDVQDSGQEVQNLSALLQEAGGEKVAINIASDGGEVFLGLKLSGLLSTYKGETVANIYGFAASIATAIAVSVDKAYISKFAFFMIHNSWAFLQGNKEEIKRQGRTLREIDNLLASMYVEKVKRNGKLINNSETDTLNYFKNLMEKETFLPADKAIELGLVDGYIEEPEAEFESIALATAQNKYNFKSNNSKMKDKKGLFAAVLAALVTAFGFNKEEAEELQAEYKELEAPAAEAQAALDSPEDKKKAKEHYEEEEEEEKKEPKAGDKYKEMEEKLKAMEEEIKQLKEEKKAMEEEKKKDKKEKAELQAAVEKTASFAAAKEKEVKESSIKADSIFSAERQKALNALFDKARK